MRTYGVEFVSSPGSKTLTFTNAANPGFFMLIGWGAGGSNANGAYRNEIFRASGGLTPTNDVEAKFSSRSPAPQSPPATGWGTFPTISGSSLLTRGANGAGPPIDWAPPRPHAAPIYADGEQGRIDAGSQSVALGCDGQWIEGPMVPDARSRPSRRCGRRRDCHVYVNHTNQLQKKTGGGAYEYGAPSYLTWSAPLPVYVPDHVPDWMQRFGAGGPTTFEVSLAGAVTPTGALLREARKTLAGSQTPAGALGLQDQKILAGSVSPAGALVKEAQKPLGGAVTPSGALSNSKVVLLALAGAITPSGALARLVDKALAGQQTPSGALSRLVGAILAGAQTPSGAIIREIRKTLGGALSPSGSLTKQPSRALSGAVAPSGALTKTPGKALAGTVAPSGALTRTAGKVVAGLVAPSGSLVKLVARAFAGAVTAVGTVANVVTLPPQPFDWAVGPLSVKWDAHTLEVKWRGESLRAKWRGGPLG